jgi:hypothetical protein
MILRQIPRYKVPVLKILKIFRQQFDQSIFLPWIETDSFHKSSLGNRNNRWSDL